MLQACGPILSSPVYKTVAALQITNTVLLHIKSYTAE